MTAKDTELSKRLVIGQKRDGRRCYDPDAKRELIEACMLPGVSVASMALRHGVNANLVRTWISQYQRQAEVMPTPRSGTNALIMASSFVPVVGVKASAKTSPLRFSAELPNGVRLDLSDVGVEELPLIMKLLSQLPCSGSTQG